MAKRGKSVVIQPNVYENQSGQKFTVRGSIANITYGEKSPARPSLASVLFGAKKTAPPIKKQQTTSTRNSFHHSTSFMHPDILRGKNIPVSRKSVVSNSSSIKSKLDRYESLSFEQSTKHEAYIKSVNWDEEIWVLNKKNVFDDDADLSRQPSYTIKNVAYHLECEMLYMEAKMKYDAQFHREMEHFIATKQRICDQYFTRSFLSYTTLWPPLHTKRELNIFTRTFFQLNQKQKKRLEYLMKTDLSLGS